MMREIDPIPSMRTMATGLGFPEGPVWFRDGSVAVVEIAGQCVTRVESNGTRVVIGVTGGGPNGLAVGPDGAFYVCNNGGYLWKESGGRKRPMRGVPADYRSGSIDRMDPKTGDVKRLYEHCGDHPLKAPNDIVFDQHGGFYFTDLGKVRIRDLDWGGVYYATCDGSQISEVLHPLCTPNGIALSPSGDELYVAETESGRLLAYTVEEPGKLRRPVRQVCQLPGFDRCDSIAVDAAGNISIGAIVSGSIVTVTPHGELLDRIRFADTWVTNLCFGGPDYATAFVTLSGFGELVALDWEALTGRTGMRAAFEL